MAEVIYLTGPELQTAITEIYSEVQGSGIGQAAEELVAQVYTLRDGTEIYVYPTAKQIIDASAYYAQQTGATAGQTFREWLTQAQVRGAIGVSALGAAAASAWKCGQGVLFGDAALSDTLVGAGGVLNISAPVAAAAVAPVFGVSIGAGLYNANPALWTKISQALLPCCYNDSQVLPAILDAVNNVTYLETRAFDAIRNLFIEEGIAYPGQEPSSAIPPGTYTSGGLTYVQALESAGWTIVSSVKAQLESLAQAGATVVPPVRYSPTRGVFPAGGSGTLTVNNSGTGTLRGTTFSLWGRNGIIDAIRDQSSSTTFPMSGNYQVCISQGEFPEGTAPWTGSSVDYDNLPVKHIAGPNGRTIEYKQLRLPQGENPTISDDPEEYPDPAGSVDPDDMSRFVSTKTGQDQWPDNTSSSPQEQISPTSNIDPIFNPIPTLSPDYNPSLPSSEQPGEMQPQSPGEPGPAGAPGPSGGLSPSPVFPVPGVPFPTINPSGGPGLIRIYNPTPSEFIAFSNWLWVTYADATIDKIWNNPFDGVIGAHEIYITPEVYENKDGIRCGFLNSGVQSNVVSQRYVQLDCGSMVIPEYYGNYLDYSPYSKAMAYLPFIGIVELDVDDIVGHAINILYHIDTYNGSCIAQITVAKEDYSNTIYQFSGNCAVDVPLSGGSQAAIRAGMISAAAQGLGTHLNGILNGAMFGGLAGALVGGVTSGISAQANYYANMVSQKSSVQHSGSFGSSCGAMGIKTPYIIIRRPVQKKVINYNIDYGFPAHKKVTVGECEGYLRVIEVNVQSSLATDEEKLEIEKLLKSGVYVT